jgi:hypothetical protein
MLISLLVVLLMENSVRLMTLRMIATQLIASGAQNVIRTLLRERINGELTSASVLEPIAVTIV